MSELFPKCLVYKYLHIKCPGCGSQRTIYYLLNGELIEACKMNILVVVSIPYLFLVCCCKIVKTKLSQKVLNVIYGYYASLTILVLVIVFTILRNIV